MSSLAQEVVHPPTNGFHATKSKVGEKKAVWEVLSQWVPSQSPDHDYWWRLTGPHLALTLQEAGYSAERQYEILLFYYYWAVPYLGQKPQSDGRLKWNSLLNVNGAPIEYSWKWNTPTSDPEVRFTMEPLDKFSGTALDPLNHTPSFELLHRLAAIVPETDLTLTNHFLSAYFDHDKAKYMEEVKMGAPMVTTIMVCFEFNRTGLSTKTYFCPRKLGQKSIAARPVWESAIRDLEPNNAALDALNAFIETSPEGKSLTASLLAVDNTAVSRLKFYHGGPRTSFASVREIMSLGGRITGIEKQLEDLHALLKAITPMADDHPDDEDVPKAVRPTESAKESLKEAPALLGGFLYHFDIAPGAALPEIKLYACVRNFGLDDLTLAKGITGWMETQGRGGFCANYMRVLQGVAGTRPLDMCYGIQTFVSCIFKKGGLNVTSYFSPKIEH